MKKIVTALLALTLLGALTTAIGAGSSADPLVSKSYVDGTYTDQVLAAGQKDIDAGLRAAYDKAVAALGGEDTEAVRVTAGYEPFVMRAGAGVTLTTGSSFMVTKGNVTVRIESGSVINVSTGTEARSGATLALNARYFCAEGTRAVFEAAEASEVILDGAYTPGDGVAARETYYADVGGTNWFYGVAVYAHDNQIFPDWDQPYFRANEAATRAETVYALWMALGAPRGSTQASFGDLTEDWYRDAVNWSVENGIILGFDEDNTFRPHESLTREQLGVILYRYTRYTGGDVDQSADLSVFTDADRVGGWAQTEMRWAVAAGILQGMNDGTMAPKDASTRAQVATVIMRHVSGRV